MPIQCPMLHFSEHRTVSYALTTTKATVVGKSIIPLPPTTSPSDHTPETETMSIYPLIDTQQHRRLSNDIMANFFFFVFWFYLYIHLTLLYNVHRQQNHSRCIQLLSQARRPRQLLYVFNKRDTLERSPPAFPNNQNHSDHH